MPRFQFKVYDPGKGVVRTGWTNAADLEEARVRLQEAELDVRSLKVCEDSAVTAKLEVQPGTGVVVQRSVGSYRPSLWERLRDLHVPEQYRNGLLILGALFGLLLLFFGGAADRWNGATTAQEPPYALHLVVSGRLKATEAIHPESVRFVLRCPQIPLTLDFTGDEVLAVEGRFNLEASVESRTVPQYCELEVSGDGFSPVRLSRLELAGTDTLRCEAPLVQLQSLPR